MFQQILSKKWLDVLLTIGLGFLLWTDRSRGRLLRDKVNPTTKFLTKSKQDFILQCLFSNFQGILWTRNFEASVFNFVDVIKYRDLVCEFSLRHCTMPSIVIIFQGVLKMSLSSSCHFWIPIWRNVNEPLRMLLRVKINMPTFER